MIQTFNRAFTPVHNHRHFLVAQDLKGELVMIWGRQDPHVPATGRAAVYKGLSEAGVRFSWHEVNGEHAFMRDEGDRYDGEAACLCMSIALELFHRAL